MVDNELPPELEARLKRLAATALIRQAGQMEQRARADLPFLPRGVDRAANNEQKRGRKGAKARARIARAARKYGL